MLSLNRLPLPKPQSDKIRKWLGTDGHREFMDYLVAMDAGATTEAANAMAVSYPTEVELVEAENRFKEAVFWRRMIDEINKMRDPDFMFERCEVAPLTTATTAETKEP